MAIHSQTFGRVTLTDADAAKFKAQVTYGKPKAAGVEAVKTGTEMSRRFRHEGGTITMPLKRAGK